MKGGQHYIIVRDDGTIENPVYESDMPYEDFHAIVGSSEYMIDKPIAGAMLWFNGNGQNMRLPPNLVITGLLKHCIVGPVLITKTDEKSSGFDEATHARILDVLKPFTTKESMEAARKQIRTAGEFAADLGKPSKPAMPKHPPSKRKKR
jgi:hypothetical protein